MVNSPLSVAVDGWRTASAGHHEFRLRVSAGGHTWVVCRRYSSFETLHANLRTLAPSALPARLPAPKLLWQSRSALLRRERALEAYLLRSLQALQGEAVAALHEFLGAPSNLESVPICHDAALPDGEEGRQWEPAAVAGSAGAGTRDEEVQAPTVHALVVRVMEQEEQVLRLAEAEEGLATQQSEQPPEVAAEAAKPEITFAAAAASLGYDAAAAEALQAALSGGEGGAPPHFGLAALLATVESGAIAPLSGQWVVALHERGGRLLRRQDLPPEAFFPADELRRLTEALGDDYGLLFAGLS